MERVRYKTTLHTPTDVNLVAPVLDKTLPNAIWRFDINSAEKMLTVEFAGKVNDSAVRKALRTVGFDAINLEDYYAIY